jgi:hypothetical protein
MPCVDLHKALRVTPATPRCLMIVYGGLDILLRTIFTVFASSTAWRVFSFTLGLSPIVLNTRVTTCLWLSYIFFLNDLVIDSPHMGRARSAPTHNDSQRYMYLHDEKCPDKIPVGCVPTRYTVFLLCYAHFQRLVHSHVRLLSSVAPLTISPSAHNTKCVQILPTSKYKCYKCRMQSGTTTEDVSLR